MKKQVLVAGFVLFLALQALAVSSVDAVNYVVSSNNFLYEGETYSAPNVAIKEGNAQYWAIPLTSGSDVITYFPVDAGSGLLSA